MHTAINEGPIWKKMLLGALIFMSIFLVAREIFIGDFFIAWNIHCPDRLIIVTTTPERF